MAVTSESGLTDEARGELNPEPETEESIAARTAAHVDTPKRPGKSAPIAKWVDYVVSLGADRTFVTEDTEHVGWEIEDGRPVQVTVTEPALTKADLIALADRLGG